MIYLDNSATTYPKPPSVIRAVQQAMRSDSFNPGRGGYRQSLLTAQKVYEARESVRRFFNAPNVENVIFTPGCTYSLNTVIKGVLKQGDHVIISSFEHNAVLRPLYKMVKEGKITYSVAQVSVGDDEATITRFREAINEKTRMIICTHASNVFGFRLPVERLCALAHSYGILFCLDAAQSAGILPIDMQSDGYDFICCAGHKSLYGPMGTGLLLINSGIETDSLIEGGTGSLSAEAAMPSFYPDKLEAGTMNIPGILGLQVGIRFVEDYGVQKIHDKESNLIRYAIENLRDQRHITIYDYPEKTMPRVPVFSFTLTDTDSESVVRRLSEQYGIAVRGGLHCAPLAHLAMGTESSGTVRVSPSVFTTREEMNVLIRSLKKIR